MCPAGSGRIKGYQGCEPCAPGSYNDGTQTTQSCTKCPEGYTSSETGATDASGCTGTCLNRWVHMNSSYLKSANDASGCPGILYS